MAPVSYLLDCECVWISSEFGSIHFRGSQWVIQMNYIYLTIYLDWMGHLLIQAKQWLFGEWAFNEISHAQNIKCKTWTAQLWVFESFEMETNNYKQHKSACSIWKKKKCKPGLPNISSHSKQKCSLLLATPPPRYCPALQYKHSG